MSNILLTGGRAPATLEIARILSRAGHRVHSAESLYPNLLTFSNSVYRHHRMPSPRHDLEGYRGALLAIIESEQIDLVIPTCEETYAMARIAPDFPASCTALADSFEKLDRLHNKSTFIETARKHGIVVPETHLISSSKDVANIDIAYPRWIIKAVYSRFACSIIEHLRGEQVSLSGDGPWVAQQYIDGVSICSYGIAYKGELFAHAAYPSRYTWGRGATMYFEGLDDSRILSWVRDFVRKEQFTGQISFDFILGKNGTLYPIECNPRVTSGVHLLRDASGIAKSLTLEPGFTAVPANVTPSMLGIPMLLNIVKGIRISGIRRFLSDFCSARDVIFSLRDPFPFFCQMLVWLRLFSIGLRHGISSTEATTYDIEYNGPAR